MPFGPSGTVSDAWRNGSKIRSASSGAMPRPGVGHGDPDVAHVVDGLLRDDHPDAALAA